MNKRRRMLRTFLAAMLSVSVLTACQSELPKNKVELYAAIAYVIWGMEEGNNKFSAERVDRQVLPDSVQYLVHSKVDEPASMIMTIRSPRECVFTIKGTYKDGTLEKIDLNKATTFEFYTPADFFAYLLMKGPQVYCVGDKCEDEKAFLMLEQRGSISEEQNRSIADRKLRAVGFIRSACHGKPF